MLSSTTKAPESAHPPRRPPLGLLASEVPRATGELAVMAAVRPLFAAAPRGDGHPVIVLPGFVVGDASTRYLRRFLRERGYHVHGWRLGRNLGPTSRIVRGLDERFAAVSEMHGRKCSIVGWSLGGTFAREVARDNAEAVRQVITLGTPIRLDSIDQLAGGPLFKALSFLHDSTAMTVDDIRAERTPLEVPSTSIFSRTDGFVPWQLCDQGRGPRHESVEVRGSHLGLGVNPSALAVVADRLALPEHHWSPFADTRLSRMVCPTRRRERARRERED